MTKELNEPELMDVAVALVQNRDHVLAKEIKGFSTLRAVLHRVSFS